MSVDITATATARVLHACAHPRCPTLLPRGRSRCPKHQLGTSRQRYAYLYGAAWQRERMAFLAANPWCIVCGRPANTVDHKTSHRGDAVLFWDMSNWQPICKRDHDAKTAREVLRR